MGYSNSTLIVKIIHLLEVKRDGLILIDGKWGTGKTFFVKNILPDYYNLNSFFYISLLGVKSLIDFKAKLIDCYYLKDVSTLKSGLDSISGIGSISSGSPASANVINGMFASIGSSIRENILSKLNGIFILDDIERLHDSVLANEILTYCHSLYTTEIKNTLDFIVVSNTSTESPLKLNHKEKIISDSVHYKPSIIDVLQTSIIEDKLKNLPLGDRELFTNLTTLNNIVNIRILSRTLNTAAPLYSHAKDHPNLDWIIPSTTLLSSIFSFFVLSYTYNKPISSLIKDEPSYLSALDESMSDIEKKLWSNLNNYKITNDVKHYYSGHSSLNDILGEIFYEPQPLSMLDVVISPRPELNEIDEEIFYITIIDFISKRTPCKLHHWLKAIRNYEYLVFHKYIPKSSKLTLPFMTSKLIEFTDDEILELYEKDIEHRSINSYGGLEDGKFLSEILSYRHDYIKNKINLINIKEIVESKGWGMFNVSLLSELDPYGNYKPLEMLGAPFLTKCIFKKWSVRDIEQFNAFLQSNYRISNISQFSKNERKHLIYLKQKLEIFCLSHKKSFRFGAIHGLNNTLTHAISCL